MQRYDLAVVGLGIMGSAALYAAAKRGLSAIGVDQSAALPHALGSSHGSTRIIRQAYFEHPDYVPLVQRAFAAWRALEADSGASIVFETGAMMLGREDSPLVAGALRAAEIHGLPYEILDGGAVSFRFPAFSLDPDEVGVYEEKAGYLRAETAWQAFLNQSQQRGAAVRLAHSVSGWDLTARGVQIRLGDGASIEAERVIVSAGPWTGRFWPYPLTVERQVVFWFESPALNAMAHYPVFMRQDVLGRIAYGFPYLVGEGLKAARHHGGASGAVPEVDRRVHVSDEEQVRELMQFIPACASAPVRQAVVCLYTNTPDEHFVMGPVAGTEGRVVMAGGFSGHGFKFASILGELLVKQTESAALLSDLALFDPARFRGGGSPPDSAI